MFLSIILSLLFFVLGGLHVYWFFGGEFGFAASLPTNEQGERVVKPKKLDCIMVGVGLIFFGLFYLMKSGLVEPLLPVWMLRYGGWFIASIFLLRAVGDFRYVGFFKKINHTAFAKRDTTFFSPLCMLICVLGIGIQLLPTP